MPTYHYEAIDEFGANVSGFLDADTGELARTILNARGFMPTRIAEAPRAASGLLAGRLADAFIPVRPWDLILFTKQFRTMLRAGVPIVRLLQILEAQTENTRLRRVIAVMGQDIIEGASLFSAFSRHPSVFSPLYCGMVQAGEASGALPEVLDRLTYILDHEYKIRSEIRAAMQYPLIVVVLLAIAFVLLLAFVMPKFVRIFLGAGLTLPLPTQFCLFLYNLVADHWVVFLGIAASAAAMLRYFLGTGQGKFIRDRLLLRMPVLGTLFVKAAMSRFASIFSILQQSGVGVMESMKILSRTVGNVAIAREFDKITERLGEGRGIAEPLSAAAYFPPMVTNMVAIGEESGNLDEMLTEISTHFDVEVEYAMKKLTDAIGPLLTIGLAAVVGFFALAIFLPMWDLIGTVK